LTFKRGFSGEVTSCVAEMIFDLATNFRLGSNFDEVSIIGSAVSESIEGSSGKGHCGLIRDANQGIVSRRALESLICGISVKPTCFINSLVNFDLVLRICWRYVSIMENQSTD